MVAWFECWTIGLTELASNTSNTILEGMASRLFARLLRLRRRLAWPTMTTGPRPTRPRPRISGLVTQWREVVASGGAGGNGWGSKVSTVHRVVSIRWRLSWQCIRSPRSGISPQPFSFDCSHTCCRFGRAAQRCADSHLDDRQTTVKMVSNTSTCSRWPWLVFCFTRDSRHVP
jgi:hypothetical protein